MNGYPLSIRATLDGRHLCDVKTCLSAYLQQETTYICVTICVIVRKVYRRLYRYYVSIHPGSKDSFLG